MDRLELADTELARWLAAEMATYRASAHSMPGISQQELAKKAGVSQSTVFCILKTGRVPNPKTLRLIGGVFDVPLEDLVHVAYGG